MQTYERAAKKGMDLKDLIENFGKGGPPAAGGGAGGDAGATGNYNFDYIISFIDSNDFIFLLIINRGRSRSKTRGRRGKFRKGIIQSWSGIIWRW